MLKKNVFLLQKVPWILIITIYSTVGGCKDCVRKKNPKTSSPASTSLIPSTTPGNKNTSPNLTPSATSGNKNISDVDPSINSIHSDTSSSSGVSSGGSFSGTSNGSSSSGVFSSSSFSPSVPPLSPPPPTDFAGLPNIGNTCFMNAVLQIIAALYADEVQQNDALKNLVHKINTGSQPLDRSYMETFRDLLPAEVQDMVKSGIQQDPYQFITSLTGAINFLHPINCTEYLFFKKAADSNNIYKIEQQPTFMSVLPGSNCVLPIPILTNISELSEMIQFYQNDFVEEGTSLDSINLDGCTTICAKTEFPCVEMYKDRLTADIPHKKFNKKDYLPWL